MNILSHDQINIAHPSWCVPLHCDTRVEHDPAHRTAPDVFIAAETDVQFAVAASREDEIRSTDGTLVAQRYVVALEVLDLGSTTDHGDPIHAVTALQPADARRFAALLVEHADRAEALHAQDTAEGAR